MLNIDVHNLIENQKQAIFHYGSKEYTFGLDDLRQIIENNPEENEICLNIHCIGGSVSEGLAIYDYLRTSGKTIYTNIEGDCHSMAIVLLLSAPLENRSCNKNASALIHKVSQWVMEDNVTEKKAQEIASEIRQYEQKIISIYAERTGKDKDYLQSIMDEEKIRDANFLKDNNFVNRINEYNTNQKHKKTMSKTLLQRAKDFLLKQGILTNFVFSDNEGNKLFETAEEGDHLEIGMTASPDGIFTLAEDTSELKAGTVITIENDIITDLQEPANEELEELKKETGIDSQDVNALKVIKDLQAQLNEKQQVINEAKEIISDFVPEERKATPIVNEELNVIERLKQKRNK